MTEEELYLSEADSLEVSESDILNKNIYIPVTVGVKIPEKEADYYNSINNTNLSGLPLVVALVSTVIKVGVDVTTRVMAENGERARAEEAIRMQRAKNDLHKDIKEYVKKCVESYTDYVSKKEENEYIPLQYALDEYLSTGKYLSGSNQDIIDNLRLIYLHDMSSDSNGYDLYNKLFYRNGFDGSLRVLNDNIQSIKDSLTPDEQLKTAIELSISKIQMFGKKSSFYINSDILKLIKDYNESLSHYGLDLILVNGEYKINWFDGYLRSKGGSHSIEVTGGYFGYRDILGQSLHTNAQLGRYEDEWQETSIETIDRTYQQPLEVPVDVKYIESFDSSSIIFSSDRYTLYNTAREYYKKSALYKFYTYQSEKFKNDILWAVVSGVPPWIIRAYINGAEAHKTGVSEAKIDCKAIDLYINSVIDVRRKEFETLIKEKEIEYNLDIIESAEDNGLISLQESITASGIERAKAIVIAKSKQAQKVKAEAEANKAKDILLSKNDNGTAYNPVGSKAKNKLVRFLDNNKLYIGAGVGAYLISKEF